MRCSVRLIAIYLSAGFSPCSGFKTAIPQDSLKIVPDSIADMKPLNSTLKNDLLRQIQQVMPTINKLLRNHSQKIRNLRAPRLIEAMRQVANRSKTARSPDEVLKFVGQAVQDAGVANEVAQLAHDLDIKEAAVSGPNSNGGADSALVGVAKAGVWPFIYDWPNFHPRTSFRLDERLKIWGSNREEKMEYLPNLVPKLVFAVSYFLNIKRDTGEVRFRPCWAVGTGALFADVTGEEFGGDDFTVSIAQSGNVPGWSWTPFDLNYNIRGIVFGRYAAQDDGGDMGRFKEGDEVTAVMTANLPGQQYALCKYPRKRGEPRPKIPIIRIDGDFPAVVISANKWWVVVRPGFDDDRRHYRCNLEYEELDANLVNGDLVVATSGFKTIDIDQYKVAIARDDIGIVLRRCLQPDCYDALIAFDKKGPHWVSVLDFHALLKAPKNNPWQGVYDLLETAVSSTSVGLEYTSTNLFVAVNFGMCISGKTQGGLCQTKDEGVEPILKRLKETFSEDKVGRDNYPDVPWIARRSNRRNPQERIAPLKAATGDLDLVQTGNSHTAKEWAGIVARKFVKIVKRLSFEMDIEHTWCNTEWTSFKVANW